MNFKYFYFLYLTDLLDISGNGIDRLRHNCMHFHLPIDNIVLQHPTVNLLYSRFIGSTSWSRIDDYLRYLAFQRNLQEAVKIPLIVLEGQIWR